MKVGPKEGVLLLWEQSFINKRGRPHVHVQNGLQKYLYITIVGTLTPCLLLQLIQLIRLQNTQNTKLKTLNQQMKEISKQNTPLI